MHWKTSKRFKSFQFESLQAFELRSGEHLKGGGDGGNSISLVQISYKRNFPDSRVEIILN